MHGTRTSSTGWRHWGFINKLSPPPPVLSLPFRGGGGLKRAFTVSVKCACHHAASSCYILIHTHHFLLMHKPTIRRTQRHSKEIATAIHASMQEKETSAWGLDIINPSLPTGSPLGLNSSAREELERVKKRRGGGGGGCSFSTCAAFPKNEAESLGRACGQATSTLGPVPRSPISPIVE